MSTLKLEKSGVSESGVFTIKEYRAEGEIDFISLIRMLQAGSCIVQEVVSYVFEGEDPLGLDARSFSAEEFISMYPEMKSYDKGLAFDVILLANGHPVTIELTEGEPVIATNSLDKEIELPDLLVPEQDRFSSDPVNDPFKDPWNNPVNNAGNNPVNNAGNDPVNNTGTDSANNVRNDPVNAAENDLADLVSLSASRVRKMAIAAMLLSRKPEFENVNMDLVVRMCLLHGFESRPDQDNTAAGNTCHQEDLLPQNEPGAKRIEETVRLLDQPEWKDQPETQRILEEMSRMETREAQVYRALDRACSGK